MVWCEGPWPDIKDKGLQFHLCHRQGPSPFWASTFSDVRCGGQPPSFPRNSLALIHILSASLKGDGSPSEVNQVPQMNRIFDCLQNCMCTQFCHQLQHHRQRHPPNLAVPTQSAPSATLPPPLSPTPLQGASKEPDPIYCFVPPLTGWALKTLFSEVWEPWDTQSNLRLNFPH